MFSNILHRKQNFQLKIENDEPHKQNGGGGKLNACAPEGLSLHAPLVSPGRILLFQPGDKS